MKKTFHMNNLDCANCAAKMERAILKIDGVKSATVSFFAQKLVLEAEDDKWDAALKAACEAIRKVDADCSVNLK
ncbi:MAG: cation transporter [Clostridia bacterium]|nr:cation transporter [Clostridia bacterium]